MSDFTSNFWPVFITVIAVGGIVACGLGLWLTSRIKVASKPGDNTSGHIWDEDIREDVYKRQILYCAAHLPNAALYA